MLNQWFSPLATYSNPKEASIDIALGRWRIIFSIIVLAELSENVTFVAQQKIANELQSYKCGY
jgi:hypothetical protein